MTETTPRRALPGDVPSSSPTAQGAVPGRGPVTTPTSASGKNLPGASEARAPGPGAAPFDNGSLFDLVQFECLRRSQRVLRVASRGQIGFLYFRAGQIVHAATLRAVGEGAVTEILSWRSGTVEPWAAVWPEQESITVPWQSLLIGMGHSRPAATPAAAPPSTSPTPAVESVVLARNGRVMRGSSTSGLPEAAAYAAQMADLIGEFLGLESFRTLEASFDDVHYLVSRTADGGLFAQRGSDPYALGNALQATARGE